MKIKVRGAHRRCEVSGKFFLNHEIRESREQISGINICDENNAFPNPNTEGRKCSIGEFKDGGWVGRVLRACCDQLRGFEILLIVLPGLVGPLVVVVAFFVRVLPKLFLTCE